MEWHLCERISIGPFERGPISFVLETHDNREAPSKCMEGEFTTTEILNAMWIDDPAVANFLKNELDLPIGVSSAIVRDDGPIEGLETWSVEIGGHRSWLVNPTPISNPTFTLHDVYRYYWQHAEGIGIMDFTSDTVSPSYDSPFSFGEVSPPFVASVLGSPAYTGYGGIFSDTSSSSKFELFGDFECEDPL